MVSVYCLLLLLFTHPPFYALCIKRGIFIAQMKIPRKLPKVSYYLICSLKEQGKLTELVCCDWAKCEALLMKLQLHLNILDTVYCRYLNHAQCL